VVQQEVDVEIDEAAAILEDLVGSSEGECEDLNNDRFDYDVHSMY
jgi:hypothetical protein